MVATGVPQDRTGEARSFPSSKLAVLRKHPIFCDLDSEAFDQLCRYAKHATLKRGTPIFAKGDPPTSLFAVISGTVKISISSPDGRNAILNLIGPGEIFGEMALLDRTPRSATVRALSPVETYTLSADDFHGMLERPPTDTRVRETARQRAGSTTRRGPA